MSHRRYFQSGWERAGKQSQTKIKKLLQQYTKMHKAVRKSVDHEKDKCPFYDNLSSIWRLPTGLNLSMIWVNTDIRRTLVNIKHWEMQPTWLSISIGVSRYWLNCYFWVNCSFNVFINKERHCSSFILDSAFWFMRSLNSLSISCISFNTKTCESEQTAAPRHSQNHWILTLALCHHCHLLTVFTPPTQ